MQAKTADDRKILACNLVFSLPNKGKWTLVSLLLSDTYLGFSSRRAREDHQTPRQEFAAKP